MLKFCKKHDGAIAVFLTLILLPTFVFQGLMIDGVRIYGSKFFVSEAGKLAMNAALSDYDQMLKDTYGLIAMAHSAEELEEEVTTYFKNTLDARGISTDYVDQTVGYVRSVLRGSDAGFDSPLITFSNVEVDISNPANTEIWRADVMRQQVLEYMKFRGPVMLADRAIFGHLRDDMFKNLAKEEKAVKAQARFENKMDKLQGVFDALKEDLDIVNNSNGKVIKQDVNNTITSVMNRFKDEVSPLAVGNAYLDLGRDEAKYESEDKDELMQKVVDMIDTINHRTNNLKGSNIKITVGELIEIEQMRMAIARKGTSYTSLELMTLPGMESATLSGKYFNALKTLFNFSEKQIPGRLKNIVKECADELKEIYDAAKAGEKAAQEALDDLDQVEIFLENLKNDYDDWGDTIDDLPDGSQNADGESTKENMSKYRTDNYEDIFGDDFDKGVPALREKLQKDLAYHKGVRETMEQIKFFGYTIKDLDIYGEVFARRVKETHDHVDRMSVFNNARNVWETFFEDGWCSDRFNFQSNTFEKITKLPDDIECVSIADDDFYMKVKAICDKDTSVSDADKEEGEKGKGEVSNIITELMDLFASTDIEAGDISGEIPSVWLNQTDSNSGDSVDIDSGSTDISNEDDREKMTDAYTKDNSTISGLASLGEKINSGSAEILERLYIVEYALDMFSCYTSDKTVDKNNKFDTIDEPVSRLTEAPLKERPFYRAEAEYILWGNKNAKVNVELTKASIFGVQLIGNSVSGLTNSSLKGECRTISRMFPVPYLVKKAIMAALMIACIMIETLRDIDCLCKGGKVCLYKKKTDWGTMPLTGIFQGGFSQLASTSSESNLAFYYTDYIWLFMILNAISTEKEDAMLVRMADCIELNKDVDGYDSIKEMATMVQVKASAEPRTDFMQKIPEFSDGAVSFSPFKIQYYGAQGE